jgi:predicted ATPase
MITHLRIKNFKSHKDTSLALGSLNLLCGQNGVGKSSVIQALLLLRQSHQKDRLREGLDLNKPLCEIGTAKDALFQGAEDDVISFTLNFEQENIEWSFTASKLEATFLDLLPIEKIKNISFEEFLRLRRCSLFNDTFQYLSAARFGPQPSYPKDDYAVERQRQLSIEKGQGELVAHFLYHFGQEKIKFSNMLNPATNEETLLYQTSAWEREICQGINVKINPDASAFKINYSFSKEIQQSMDVEFKAENVGFGVSYALSVIVALLSADKDSLIIIENPEAHLHPYGQAKLAELMCLAASNGVQIIAETHSDHIINGTLVAVKNQKINAEDVKIWYFDRKEDDGLQGVRATDIPVSADGRITYPPKGFFDQISKDRKTLMGF